MNNSRLSLGKLYVRKYKAGQDSHPLPYQPEVRDTFGPAEANALQPEGLFYVSTTVSTPSIPARV